MMDAIGRDSTGFVAHEMIQEHMSKNELIVNLI